MSSIAARFWPTAVHETYCGGTLARRNRSSFADVEYGFWRVINWWSPVYVVVLSLVAGVLLEKQVLVVCPNLALTQNSTNAGCSISCSVIPCSFDSPIPVAEFIASSSGPSEQDAIPNLTLRAKAFEIIEDLLVYEFINFGVFFMGGDFFWVIRWDFVERKYCVPVDPIAYAALKRFALQKIGKAWRDHKSRLKKQHYIPDSRNKARVKSNVPTGCISQDWDILVEHWYTDDVVIESEKNKERRSKQDDVHTAGSCSFAVHATKKAKTDGCPVKRSVLYPILHSRKNGSIVNPVVAAKIDKMKELMADPANHLQSSNTTGSIVWAPDDVFAKVMGKERKGRIRGVGFGPSPSGRSSKNALTDIETHSRQARDNEVAQLKATLATMEEKLADFDEMKEKLAGFDEMKEKLSQFEEMEQRMAQMLHQMQHISSQCNQDTPLAPQSPALQKSSTASYQPSSL
ncbi:hypothetical protein SO802_031448 [Lithocarpus litseifolius]|uniref:Uncharacterized protein n=1 Tax=Lithocarpus litseifolius TaxID=425828 RepID=A0AAW2BMW1_9ROSI